MMHDVLRRAWTCDRCNVPRKNASEFHGSPRAYTSWNKWLASVTLALEHAAAARAEAFIAEGEKLERPHRPERTVLENSACKWRP
jgi:hypothetical protein